MPTPSNPALYARSLEILQSLYGPDAQFRRGQYEAIEATLSNQRTLVVQRTGWGKSLVYFLATKLQREDGKGITLVVSPLISLMDNQLEAARGMGLVCEVLNGSVEKEQRPQILDAMANGTVDLVFITPETLFTPDVQAVLPRTPVGLFVIDEAHCISDWGHDFRLEYTRLRSLIPQLAGTPLLATTATATDSVVTDICEQLGGNVFVSRGPLVRDSLAIQVVRVKSAAQKYAWLLANVGALPGSGIVYCTTTHDCDRLAELFQENGISARPYHAKRDAAERTQTLTDFNDNRIKVLAATSALGMGYDKDDIAFVIHFQIPSGIVAYYQQIGRAGRKLDRAYAFLLYGDKTDITIQRHFIESAFPTERETQEVMDLITGAGSGGVRFTDLLGQVNMRRARLNKALEFLQNDGYVDRNGYAYVATPLSFTYNREHYEAITARRYAELQEMVDFAETNACYSQAVVRALGDVSAPPCGHCANCLGRDVFALQPATGDLTGYVQDFIDRDHLVIAPRKRWPSRELAKSLGDATTTIKPPNEEGFCLARYGWSGYGELAARSFEQGGFFDPQLVERGAQVLAPFVQRNGIKAIVPVPSTRGDRARQHAWYVAQQLGLPMVDALAKAPAPPQAQQANAYYQCQNARDAYSVVPGVNLPEAVLLLDDMVDSGWTLTVCGALLRKSTGCEHVYPYAVADKSN